MKFENGNEPKKGKGCFSFAFLATSIVCIVLIFTNLSNVAQKNGTQISYSDFLASIEADTLKEVNIIDKTTIKGKMLMSNGQYSSFYVEIPYDDPNLIASLKEKNVLKNVDIQEGVCKICLFCKIFENKQFYHHNDGVNQT